MKRSPKVIKLLKKLASVQVVYPADLLDATRAKFVSQIKQKTDCSAKQPVGS